MTKKVNDDTVFEAYDARGRVRTLRFHELPVGEELQKSFRKAFEAQFGHLEISSMKTNFSALRVFCTYCSQAHPARAFDKLENDDLRNFVEWLSRSGRRNSTSQSVLNIVRSLLAYAARNNTGGVPKEIDQGVIGFRREEPSFGNVVTTEARAKILAACRAEIEATEKLMMKGQAAIAVARAGGETALGEMLISISEVGKGRYVKKEELRQAVPGLVQRMQAVGFREVYAHLYISLERIFPFYLAIVAETGGNPDAIHQVKRDCFIPHPTNPNLVLFVWEKKRAHAEQYAGYSAKREWSAAGLVKKLLSLNESLVAQAKPGDRDRLFIGMTSMAGVGLSCTQLLHLQLADFIQRHGLEKFTFRDLRRSIAEEEYLKHGDIEVAKERLGHRHSSTTQGYLASPRIRQENERAIVKYAGMMVAQAKSLPRDSVQTERKKSQYAETVFGFGCSDPFAGLAPGSQKGSVCDKFYGCSTCPGAVVVLDNPRIVAKLIFTAEHLRKEKKRAVSEGWGLRFDTLYAPTLRILESDVLPLVVDEMAAAARNLIVPALPRLE